MGTNQPNRGHRADSSPIFHKQGRCSFLGHVVPARWRAIARRGVWIGLILILLGGKAFGETVYLNTGEVIKGKIVRTDAETVSIESDKGFGVIQIKREDIVQITFDQNERDISRLFGAGYFHRFVPLVLDVGGRAFGLDAVSLKMWFTTDSSVELLFGFYSTEVAQSSTLEVMTLEARYANVFSRRGNLDLYWGFGAGIVQVTNTASGLDENGTVLDAFFGGETFISSLPNLGIATEIGVSKQDVGSGASEINSLIISPSVIVRYYF